MKQNLISIIIPLYNRANLIAQTLDSILAQTYTNWECIIVDDGSTDNSEVVVKTYAAKDKRFQFFKRPQNKPKGANACRNYGFEKAKGNYINWLDSDDLFHENSLETRLEVLEDDPSLHFSACLNSTFIENPDEVVSIDKPLVMHSKNYMEDYLLNGLYFFTSSPLWRRSFLENKELFDEELHRSQERDFHFRMLLHQPKYKYLDDVLIFKRLGNDTISATASKSIKAQFSVFRYFHKVFVALKNNNVSNHLKHYVIYRQLVNYYNINQLEDKFSARIKIFKTKGIKVLNYIENDKDFKQYKFRILVGFFLMTCFRKGYKFIYFPKYNFRVNE